MKPPVLALTQGDPAGIGPEILLRTLRRSTAQDVRLVLVAEWCALEAVASSLEGIPWDQLVRCQRIEDLTEVGLDRIPVLDPVGEDRQVRPGEPGLRDAQGALAALDQGIALVRNGQASALVTAPLNKATIAEHLLPDFRGHTDYLAEGAGLGKYGHDYLMAFLAPNLRVALLSTHISLRQALETVTTENVLAALRCLSRHLPGQPRIAVAGLNPHAGEGGLLGEEDEEQVRPAVERAQAEGIDTRGPYSADSLFARAVRREFDWVLALYHDQGLIAVKTAAFGQATNWTLGLPFVRTSVDHGTAYDIAGQGRADAEPLGAAIETTLEILDHHRPEG